MKSVVARHPGAPARIVSLRSFTPADGARHGVACKASEWLRQSSRNLKLREDALVDAPEAPWANLRKKNKNEEWRFSATTLGRILGEKPEALGVGEWASATETSDLASYVAELAEVPVSDPRFTYSQVLVKDGILVSSPPEGAEGLTVTTAASGTGADDVQEALRFLDEHDTERRGAPQGQGEDFFDHLGDALAKEAGSPHLVLRVGGPDDGKTHVLHLFQVVPRRTVGSTTCWSPRVSVLVEGGRRLVLVEELIYEDSAGPDLGSAEPLGARIVLPKTRVYLREGSSLKHTLVHNGSEPKDVSVRTVQVTQDAGSSYDLLESRVAFGEGNPSAGGSPSDASLSRVEVDLWQAGEGTRTSLNSLSLITTSAAGPGASSHAGITHELRTKARLSHHGGKISQVAKMVASGGSSHCIFDGKVDVERYAQETDAAQIARGLLLTKRATINARPNLRIQADNVVASHGCTIADLEEEQLFYLASRGLDERTARGVLISSFIREITQLFTDDGGGQGVPFQKLSSRVEASVQRALELCDL